VNQPVPILMYHAVGHSPAKAAYGLSVSPGAYAEQMELLGELGFTPITTARLGTAWRSGGSPLPRKPVLITFDDGYEGVHRHALPVLARLGFVSTLFVSTGWLRGAHEEGGALDTMLDWDQVRELAAAGTEIGGHTHTHPQLDQLDDHRLWYRHRGVRAARRGPVDRPELRQGPCHDQGLRPGAQDPPG
jgi:peptidoglycan/xylan/chitin deacetylase (PgdA/CDA1 family)